jgi:hypothetical protein
MLDVDRVRSLRRLAAPVVSAYIDTNPATRRNQGDPPGYLAWLRTSARRLARRVAPDEREIFQEAVARLERELESRPARARAIVAFVGPRTWELLRLQVGVEDELQWGPPALKQLFWLLDEHRPAGVVVVSGSEARFFRVRLGEMVADGREPIVFDTAGWRRKGLVGTSHAGGGRRRGLQRDRFASRVEAQHRRFATTLASRIQEWAARHHLRPVLLVGPSAMIDPVFGALPAAFRSRVALLPENLAQLAPAALHARIEPVLTRWQRDDEASRVEELLAAGPDRVATGVDETLARLQGGRVRELVIARGLDGSVRQCERCGWADRSADRSCARCGGERRPAMLRVVIPELARRQRVSIDVVAGRAASRLRRVEGVAARLDADRRNARRKSA